MTPVVLVHGGGFDSRCWDLLLPHLAAPALAVDLPGRGARPAPRESVTFAACAEAVRDDVDAAGFDDIVLVGHSLAGCSMPAIIGALGERVRHAVFVACTVPPNGQSAFDTLDPSVQDMIRAAGDQSELTQGPMDPELAELVLGTDLTDEQFAWCLDRLVSEAAGLTTEAVDLSPLRTSLPRTWIRTVHDLILAPERQLGFAQNVGDCPVIDIEAGHMCMVGRPAALAELLDDIASR